MRTAIAIACLIACATIAALAQSSSAFDVASIRPNRASGGRPSAEFSPGGERFSATNISIGVLIVIAYGVTPRQVSPLDSVAAEKYDIQAVVDHAVTRDQMLLMLQALLADRFKLRIRREMREVPAYALVVGKAGARLHLSEVQLPWSFARARGREQKDGWIGRLIFENESMPAFASVLSTLIAVGRIVVDETGLRGNYDFEVSYTPAALPADLATGPIAPSIFTALQEQLGLRLEPRRAPLEFLIIEHVEKPSEN